MMVSLVNQSAHADSYSIWANEVESASRGLQICSEAHFKTIAGNTKPSDVPKFKNEARRTCDILKNILNVTMLTVRTRVDDPSGELAKYHQSMLDRFDAFVPAQNISPLEYRVKTLEAIYILAQHRGVLQQLLRD